MFKSVSYFFCSQISLKSVFVSLFFSHWVTDLGLVSTSIILLIFPKLSVTPVVTCPTFPRTIPSNAYCSDVVIHTIPFTLKSVPVYAVNYIVTLSMTYMMGKYVVTLLTLSFLIFSSISHCWLSVLSVTQNSSACPVDIGVFWHFVLVSLLFSLYPYFQKSYFSVLFCFLYILLF